MDIMTNIIFLDIDGVIATPEVCIATGNKLWGICPTKAGMVRALCEDTDAQLVISSTWRILHTINTFQDLLRCYQLEKHLFFHRNSLIVTDEQKNDWYERLWCTPQNGRTRGEEIDQWFDRAEELGVKIKNYVILDDDEDFYEHQKKHFIQTDTMRGMGAKEFYAARDMLGYNDL